MSEQDQMIEQLRRAALIADPPPAALFASARAAFGLSRLDAELAALLHDSEESAVGVRGDGGGDAPRLVSFGTDDVGADVEIMPGPDGVALTGICSATVVAAAVQTPGSRVELAVDEHGRFRCDSVPGPVLRLELFTTTGRTVVTTWVRI